MGQSREKPLSLACHKVIRKVISSALVLENNISTVSWGCGKDGLQSAVTAVSAVIKTMNKG